MVYLSNEIINLILSFREVNPTAKMIRKSIEDYETLQNKTNILYKFESYYLSTLMEYKRWEDHKKWRVKKDLCEPQSKIERKDVVWKILLDMIKVIENCIKNI